MKCFDINLTNFSLVVEYHELKIKLKTLIELVGAHESEEGNVFPQVKRYHMAI